LVKRGIVKIQSLDVANVDLKLVFKVDVVVMESVYVIMYIASVGVDKNYKVDVVVKENVGVTEV
jgi:hypothetical protein